MPIMSFFSTGTSDGGTFLLNPVSNIEHKAGSQTAYIKWTDPEDLLLPDGQAIGTWAGTLLVRKAGAPVGGRQDGTIVMDNKSRSAYSSVWLQDVGLADGITYYYQFFPYTTGGSYTFDQSNSFSLTPGAVALGSVSGLTARNAGNRKVALRWTDPAATVEEDGIIMARWASTMVVYKEGSYPTSTTDGTVAANVTTYNGYQNNDLVVNIPENDKVYYFAVIPISGGGNETVNESGCVTCSSQYFKLEAKPYTNSVLTYTGSSLSPVWQEANEAYMTKSGDLEGINAGEYSTTFTLKEDYCWPDGTTDPYTVKWAITKKAAVKPSYSGTLTYTGSTIAPNWVGYDPLTTRIGGDVDAVDAGNYVTQFTPLDSCEWEGGGNETISIAWTVNKAVAQTPTLTGTLTYNAAEQTPAWNNYDANKLEMTGDVTGKNARAYSTTFAPKANYTWSDGTENPVTIPWSIAKAAGDWDVTIWDARKELTPEYPAKIYSAGANCMYESELVAWADDESIVSVKATQATKDEIAFVSVTAKANGSTTVHFKFAESENYTATSEQSETLSVDMTVYAIAYGSARPGVAYEDGIDSITPATLEEWSAAIAACDEITAESHEVWVHYGTIFRHIVAGDQTTINLNGTDYAFNIIGFNHDSRSDGTGMAGMTLEMHEVLPTTYKMNTAMTNVGGWKDSTLRNTNMPEIKAMLPEQWQAMIKPVSKTSGVGGADGVTTNVTSDECFILCEEEIFGTATSGNAGEGVQYAWYKAGNSPIKSTGGTAQVRLTRSTRKSSSYAFVGVSATGTPAQVTSTLARYVSFAFGI